MGPGFGDGFPDPVKLVKFITILGVLLGILVGGAAVGVLWLIFRGH